MHCTLTSTFWGLNYHVSLIRIMFLLAKPLRGLTGENWSNCSFFLTFTSPCNWLHGLWYPVPFVRHVIVLLNLFVWGFLCVTNMPKSWWGVFIYFLKGESPVLLISLKKCHQFQLFCLKKEKKKQKRSNLGFKVMRGSKSIWK